MRICIPTESTEGLSAALAGHLGRAPFLTLVDTETGDVAVVANAPRGDGSCAPLRPLAGRGVEAVVCVGAGRRAVATLAGAGIPVLLTRARRVDGAVAAARDGGLRLLAAKDACGGHHHAGGAEHHRCRSQA